jgi:hypothetical protein
MLDGLLFTVGDQFTRTKVDLEDVARHHEPTIPCFSRSTQTVDPKEQLLLDQACI